MMKLSDYVMKFLSETGIRDVFLLPGGGCMHLLDSLGKQKDINNICCLHEQAAAIAAEAYGQYTNHIGAALVTTGPGGTNAITGVAGAWIDSTPLLVISGQVKRKDLLRHTGVRQMGIQEVDIVSIVRSITKYAVTVMNPERIRYHLQKAIHLATTGRKGPVWLDIPLDVQGSLIDEANLDSYKIPTFEIDAPALKTEMKKALGLLSQAKRPVILVGNGVRLSGCQDLFKQVIEKLKVPVLATWKASDLIAENHPLYCGKPGAIGQRGANFTQQNADWILTLGARLDLCQVAHNYTNFAREARKIVVDIDAAEINKLHTCGMKVDVGAVCDAGRFLSLLIEMTEDTTITDCSQWLSKCKAWKERYPVIPAKSKTPEGPVNPYTFIDVLAELLTADDLLVPGSSGSCAEITQQAWRIKEGQRLLNTPGLGSMGFGLPATIGACIASGGRKTIGIIGDGGLQHNIQELETLVRLGLPVKLFILNNGGYGSIKTMQDNHFKGRHVACTPDCGLTLPDICRVAAAYGLNAIRIENGVNLRSKLSDFLQNNEPGICDLVVDPDTLTSPKVSSDVLPDGRIVSRPMEDLWPFLDRTEFERNMLIPPPETSAV